MSAVPLVISIKEENIRIIEENAKKHKLTIEKYIEKLSELKDFENVCKIS